MHQVRLLFAGCSPFASEPSLGSEDLKKQRPQVGVSFTFAARIRGSRI